MPYVGRFPVDKWIKDGMPRLDGAGWITLCKCISAKDMTNLFVILEMCNGYLSNL